MRKFGFQSQHDGLLFEIYRSHGQATRSDKMEVKAIRWIEFR